MVAENFMPPPRPRDGVPWMLFIDRSEELCKRRADSAQIRSFENMRLRSKLERLIKEQSIGSQPMFSWLRKGRSDCQLCQQEILSHGGSRDLCRGNCCLRCPSEQFLPLSVCIQCSRQVLQRAQRPQPSMLSKIFQQLLEIKLQIEASVKERLISMEEIKLLLREFESIKCEILQMMPLPQAKQNFTQYCNGFYQKIVSFDQTLPKEKDSGIAIKSEVLSQQATALREQISVAYQEKRLQDALVMQESLEEILYVLSKKLIRKRPHEENENVENGPEGEEFYDSSGFDEMDDEVINEEVFDEDSVANGKKTLVEDENDDGEDLFSENFEADYRKIDALDRYDSSQLDDSHDYAPMDIGERRNLEAMLMERDVREGRLDPTVAEASGFFAGAEGAQRAARHLGALAMDQLTSDLGSFAASGDLTANIEAAVSGDLLAEAEATGYALTEFVMIENFRRRIRKDFERFLRTFRLPGASAPLYAVEGIREMCVQNGESLVVSYLHLMEFHPFLAKLVATVPIETLRIFDEAALACTLGFFSHYQRIKPEVHVRISDLPTVDNLRDLRFIHLNCLVRVAGVVTRRSGVFPQLQLVKFDCGKCGEVIGPFFQETHSAAVRIGACPACQSKGPFSVNVSQTIYRNYQRMTLQEVPGTVPAGRMPRQREVILLGDLIDCARPGDEIDLTAVYRNNFNNQLTVQNGFPVFATMLEANYVTRVHDHSSSTRLTEDDEKEIRRMGADPLIARKIFHSIAPFIHGHEEVKIALALALFGGQPKNVAGKHQLRGDINVLLLGDPGTAKSQFLKYIEKLAPRAVYTTGQGASAVGLTAAVRKDPVTREWTLEGGALVLADKGACLIDEFDKMNDRDRTSIHEAMEQQSISISKAGIVATLQARCSVIAAANPVRGRYNASLPLSQNVMLSDPILSRFDLQCVVRDVIDPIADERLAKFVLTSHIRSHPEHSAESDAEMLTALDPVTGSADAADARMVISQDLLRKYLVYARTRVHPQITSVDSDKISRLYSHLRKESLATGSIPITARHIESIIRCSEAHARLHLRAFVSSTDVDFAIRVILDSFVGAQRYSVMKSMRKTFSRYMLYQKDSQELLYFCLSEMFRDSCKYQQFVRNTSNVVSLDLAELEARARDLNCLVDLEYFLKSRLFLSNGFSYDAATRAIRKARL